MIAFAIAACLVIALIGHLIYCVVLETSKREREHDEFMERCDRIEELMGVKKNKTK